MKTSVRRTLTAAAATTGLMGLGLAGAAAHVTITPDTTAAGSHALLTVSFSHDCEGSPTNKLTISLPEPLVDAKPEIVPGWTVEKVTEALDEPLTLDNGSSVTERVGQIVYTAETPVEDGYLQQFDMSVQLPESEGETLAFPVLQGCVEGETDWAEIPAEGEDPHGLEAPAPTITLTGAEEDGHAETAGEIEPPAGEADLESASASNDSSGASTVGYVGLAAGLLGLIAGVIALLRTRNAKS
ncbi:YcnI family protein [uncultured Arthrobacter sp.]|uniref:YcnI family copper-binding membrane protein n=1 Tax=uncultured Arthrobacter sp. TaxID=114050 RepID=UPI00261D8BAC|nr:YcnI family protein [uncultured Arthrobacter sp.]